MRLAVDRTFVSRAGKHVHALSYPFRQRRSDRTINPSPSVPREIVSVPGVLFRHRLSRPSRTNGSSTFSNPASTHVCLYIYIYRFRRRRRTNRASEVARRPEPKVFYILSLAASSRAYMFRAVVPTTSRRTRRTLPRVYLLLRVFRPFYAHTHTTFSVFRRHRDIIVVRDPVVSTNFGTNRPCFRNSSGSLHHRGIPACGR